MMTPTHLVIACAALTRRGERINNIAVIAGALLPDASIYLLVAWAKFIKHIPERTLWSQTYWQEPWQTLSAISNSIPMYGLILFAAIATRTRWLTLLAAAALIHIAFDLPFHAGDAHQHFWPFSNFRYHSPLSYWDTAHHARLVAMFELAIAITAMAIVWHRFNATWVKAIIGTAVLTYIAVPLYFSATLG